MGKALLVDRPVITNQQINSIVPDRMRVEDLFLYYALLCKRDEIFARGAGGSRTPILNKSGFECITIEAPPLPEQRAIAYILGTLDDKIELNRRSELGEIPEGWCVRRIEEVAERVAMGPFGASIKVETFVPDGVPIISGQHLRDFVLEDSTFNFITDEHAKRLANANVQRGDVVFTHAGNIGQAAFIPETSRYERYVISQRQFFMRCDLSQVCPTFIAFYFTSSEGRHRLLANTSSSGVPSIARPVTYLRTIPLAIPTRTVLDAFEDLASPILQKFLKNVQINVTLAALRDTLLPKLISGELRVRDAGKMLADAAV